jgi:LmbE family N-acetylglucosaminyl deacetylase
VWRHELKGMRPHPNQATVYAPLAVGNHIDHQLARDLAWQLRKDGWQVWYYEDYPYAEEPGKLQLALNQFGSVAWKARIVPIDVTAKIAAIRGYATQVALLFGDEHAMVTRVKRFTADVACDNSLRERIRRKLAGSGGRRERLWRAVWGFHAHAERIWTSDADGLANVQERREL